MLNAAGFTGKEITTKGLFAFGLDRAIVRELPVFSHRNASASFIREPILRSHSG